MSNPEVVKMLGVEFSQEELNQLKWMYNDFNKVKFISQRIPKKLQKVMNKCLEDFGEDDKVAKNAFKYGFNRCYAELERFIVATKTLQEMSSHIEINDALKNIGIE